MTHLNQFNYHLYGPEGGRRWVFLHGLMGYGQNWRRIISGIESSERVLAFDQRGHGRSFKPSIGYAPQDYAQDLAQILDELSWDKIILVGHSMGGRNALAFAGLYPERLDHLIIEDIGPTGNPQAPEYYKNLLDIVPTPFVSRQAAKDFFFGDFLKRAKTRENPLVIANYFYANLEEKNDRSLDWRFLKDAVVESARFGASTELTETIRSLKVPTLYIRGGNSNELTREGFDKILALNPMIKGVEISGAGHWVHFDQPQAFIEALKNFVGGF